MEYKYYSAKFMYTYYMHQCDTEDHCPKAKFVAIELLNCSESTNAKSTKPIEKNKIHYSKREATSKFPPPSTPPKVSLIPHNITMNTITLLQVGQTNFRGQNTMSSVG